MKFAFMKFAFMKFAFMKFALNINLHLTIAYKYIFIYHRRMLNKIKELNNMIEELLDKYHEDDFDDLLIQIIKHMKEVKELREMDREQD